MTSRRTFAGSTVATGRKHLETGALFLATLAVAWEAVALRLTVVTDDPIERRVSGVLRVTCRLPGA